MYTKIYKMIISVFVIQQTRIQWIWLFLKPFFSVKVIQSKNNNTL